MRSSTIFCLALASAPAVRGLPREYQSMARRSDVSKLDNVVVFDAPAFEDPENPGQTLVQLQAYVSTPEIGLSPLFSGIQSFVNRTLGLDLSSNIDRATSRLALFSTFGLSKKVVNVAVSGCSSAATLPATASGSGMAIQNISLGDCGSAKAGGNVKLASSDSRALNFNIFPSGADGFGVISDIDDTVKISHTLDKLLQVKAVLIDDPTPVPGMPELYASLAKTLNPQFIYVSASPFQLYPFLRDFIDTSFAAANGPIFLNNFTTTDISALLDFGNPDGVFEYKSAMIDRIQGMYPGKKFLTVGDSTQKDPETYGEAFRKYGGDFIACAWIHQVDGANNTAERFAAAFEGVPADRFKIFTDDEIPSLADIDVAGGKCN